MLKSLFPITKEWNSYTFWLYFSVAIITSLLCRKGAIYHSYSMCYREKKNRKEFRVRKETMCYFFAYLILVLLATLRSVKVGPDTSVYVGYFLNESSYIFDIKKIFTFNQMEPGFQLYLMFTRSFTKNYHVFFLITYGLIAFSYIQFIKKFFDEKSNYILLEIYIFYFVSNMSGMRSAMGMIFLLPAFISIYEKKYCKAIILTLLASCFHYTMAINLLIIFLVWIFSGNLLKKKRWILPVSVIGVSLLGYLCLNLINKFVASTKYNFYHISVDELSLFGSGLLILLAILIFIDFRKIISMLIREQKNLGELYVVISFLILYPIIYLSGAYRIPNYYILPRLDSWSNISRIIRKKMFVKSKLCFDILLQIFVFLYLLFKFTRMSVSGSFTYII